MRRISPEDLTPDFAREIMAQPGGGSLLHCYGCGTCSMSCPVRAVDERFNPRRVIRMCILGMRREVLESDFAWLCAGCHSCQERCPQGVRIADIMTVIKNLAYRFGNVPKGLEVQRDQIAHTGRVYEITDFDNKKRLKMDLPELLALHEDVGVLLTQD